MSDFTVDLSDLHAMVRRMTRTEESLVGTGDDLDRLMARLSAGWSGSAGEAQRLAHLEWARGLATMRDALRDLRAAADLAHGNYSRAADANERMWAQTR